MPDYELFIATEDVAQAGGDAIPSPGTGVESDPKVADRVAYCDHIPICTLWGLLTGEGYQETMIDAFERVYEGAEDGPWVERLPQDLLERLCALSREQMEQIAAQWSQTEEFGDWVPEPPPPLFPGLNRLFGRGKESDLNNRAAALLKAARADLETLVRLARRAKQSAKGLYLWTCL
jgi:hypothetical protein